jgi:hypothetical protein
MPSHSAGSPAQFVGRDLPPSVDGLVLAISELIQANWIEDYQLLRN